MDASDSKVLTSEHILRDVYKRRKTKKSAPKVDIVDLDELKDFQARKRKEYESYLKRNRLDIGQWLRYAKFEADQHDLRRARSIFERTLLVNNSYIPLWLRYVDLEIQNKNINHARNILDRAISTLPRVDKLWYKYLTIEESLQNFNIVRALFKKWSTLEPRASVWDSFVEFEIRQLQFDNVRQIYSRYVKVHPVADTWLKWTAFETIYGSVDSVRQVYSMGLDITTSFNITDDVHINSIIKLAISFARWEVKKEEFERARAIITVAIDKWPNMDSLKDELVNLEKQIGNIENVEVSIMYKRRRRYEDILKSDVYNYDIWWMYLDMIQSNFISESLTTFENCITLNKPSINNTDQDWKRYLCLCARFVIYLELELNDISKCEEVYKNILFGLEKSSSPIFAGFWTMYAKFCIRTKTIDEARSMFGRALGTCPSEQIFESYLDVEIKLKEFDRVRKIFEKYLEFDYKNIQIWLRYAELEENLGDEARCRFIFEILLQKIQDSFFDEDFSSEIFRRYIQFETDAEEYDNARKLYSKWVEESNYKPMIWIEAAQYELSIPMEPSTNPSEGTTTYLDKGDAAESSIDNNNEKCRNILESAKIYYESNDMNNEKEIILQALNNVNH